MNKEFHDEYLNGLLEQLRQESEGEKELERACSGTKRICTQIEDEVIKYVVEKYQTKDWKFVSRFLPNRSSRQCRERYNLYLANGIRKEPWNEEEDALILKTVREVGNNWKLLSNLLKGRTTNDIKNRYYTHLSKKKQVRKHKKVYVYKRKVAVSRKQKDEVSENEGKCSDQSTPKTQKEEQMHKDLNKNEGYNFFDVFDTCFDKFEFGLDFDAEELISHMWN